MMEQLFLFIIIFVNFYLFHSKGKIQKTLLDISKKNHIICKKISI